MRRLVVVSNRLPTIKPTSTDPPEVEIPAGGLASAVFAALRQVPGSLWLGWNGRMSSADRAQDITRQQAGNVELLGLPLSQREITDYYHGFCNASLWPLFHCFPDRVRMDARQEACYRGVQTRFAGALRTLLRPGDVIWVHDYHFLLLGQELRRLGWTGPIGFFLHIPFPPHDLWRILPDSTAMLRGMLHYDLVGFQSEGSLDNYLHACHRELQVECHDRRVVVGPRVQRAGAYPIGIDPAEFLPPEGAVRRGGRHGVLAKVVRGRRLILGVDRLDYSKGIPERILAFEDLLARYPMWRKKVSFIQIASPSRTSVATYVDQKKVLEALVGRVNGECAEHDWVPIRYLYRSYPRSILGRFYREADIGLVTPLRDGMNLVAKEYVAAQHPASPGVLILSRCAGAADELTEAIIVNPYVRSQVADAIAHALVMPLEERVRRHQALLARIHANTVHDWGRRFLRDLERSTMTVATPGDRLARGRKAERFSFS
jgi:trehalose 6-phosphate synthase